jgi:hypothetical protein
VLETNAMSEKAIAATRAVVQAQLEAAEQELKRLRRDVVLQDGSVEEWRRNVALARLAGDEELTKASLEHVDHHAAIAMELRAAVDRRERIAAELRAALAAT